MRERTTSSGLGFIALTTFLSLALIWSNMAVAKQHPREIVEEISNQVIQVFDEHADELQDKPVKTYEKLEPIVAPYIDFARIGERILGPHWRSADNDTQERFVTEFKRSLVRTYASSMENYQGVDLRILGSRQRDGEMQVGVELGGESRVIFEFSESPEAWKLKDVTFEGISIIQNFREDFRSRLRDKDLQTVIAEMAERNREIGF